MIVEDIFEEAEHSRGLSKSALNNDVNYEEHKGKVDNFIV